MKEKTNVKNRRKTKERLVKPLKDPTLEGKDENKVGRVQEKINSVLPKNAIGTIKTMKSDANLDATEPCPAGN